MVEVHNLTKTYGTVQALRGVDFTLEPGKVYGLLGVNGAGKTTTLQLLAGYITPTAGEVLVDGISMEKSPVETKQKIGYLPEQPPLYPELKLWSRLYGLGIFLLSGTVSSDSCRRASAREWGFLRP